jgi:NAD(P)-dependent dehydrogenase (short-subunit alcohol dehydrogenase family)
MDSRAEFTEEACAAGRGNVLEAAHTSMATEPTVQDLFDLSGRVALVTGATGYLGPSLAAALAEAGATVVAGSPSAERAEAVALRLPTPKGQRHVGIALDHLDEHAAEAAFDTAVDAAGQIDILINNAHEPLAADLTTVTGDEFNRQLANATGYFVLARKLRDHVVDRGAPGAVVMLGSMYGVVGSYPEAYAGVSSASPVAYHALKGGVIQMARHLAVYWAEDGVRVNCLSPGPFPQPTAPQELRERLALKCPTGRLGAPHELKGPLLLLASDAGSYITGQNLIVDGGWTAW